MNCKPGDVAVIVRTEPAGEFLLGMLVDVLCAGRNPGWWRIKLPHPICNPLTFAVGDEDDAPDYALRPIRPGDISDEEVRDLYAPKQTEVAGV